ncbi:MAG: hypothetical protein GY715_07105 [Planctomycetes bacterium]|nr:hypothetical protein [Planctomycetota bacterium]
MKLTQRILRRIGHALAPSPVFTSDDVEIGANVTFGRNVVFTSPRVRIGDNVHIRDNVRVESSEFTIGDFGTIYDSCFFPGPGRLTIGHNFWLGTGSIVDSAGTTTIGDNVGVGAHSQLWSHIRFGDVSYGCRFHGSRPLTIDDDVWLVGQTLVSPVHIGARSLAMLGSVVTRDMEPDRVYAGVPARDVTERFGAPYTVRPIAERAAFVVERLDDLHCAGRLDGMRDRIRVVTSASAGADAPEDVLVLNVADRTYRKRGTAIEHRVLRSLLPDCKFVPESPRRLNVGTGALRLPETRQAA